MRSRQHRERTKPGDGNRKNSAAAVFNGDVGEDVEVAITEIKSVLVDFDSLGFRLGVRLDLWCAFCQLKPRLSFSSSVAWYGGALGQKAKVSL